MLVGTIRKNKPDIPIVLQASHQRPENSSTFCFARQSHISELCAKEESSGDSSFIDAPRYGSQ